jgi:electron transfer flavoprotein alpha subunit
VYVAFGLSGAVQHTCAIAGAGTVIAVNLDKEARIFDYADYGIIDDVKNTTIGE